jgi:hypothetical protein
VAAKSRKSGENSATEIPEIPNTDRGTADHLSILVRVVVVNRPGKLLNVRCTEKEAGKRKEERQKRRT